MSEIHVERLLGRRVRDRDGRVLGRLEEMCAETVDGELAVVEFHIGPEAILERIGGFALRLPFFGALPFARHSYHVPWDQMDLSDPHHPRFRGSIRDLKRIARAH
jgi:hypothetical protein